MKFNTNKCHLIGSWTKYEHSWFKLGKDKIWESNNVKLLGDRIDNESKFDENTPKICLKFLTFQKGWFNLLQ